MKKWKKKYGLIGIAALCLSLGLVACGGAEESVFAQAETTLSPVDDPNEGLGGDLLTEDTVNDFSGFAGICTSRARSWTMAISVTSRSGRQSMPTAIAMIPAAAS